MGTSKAMMEKVIVAKSRTVSPEATKICCTRYGNVMCSRGSVIPLWIDQIKAGNPITITEPAMTRFIMSLEEAVDLVLFLMLSAQPSSGQSSHSVGCNNVALGLNHRNADSSLVSRLNVGLANNVDSLRGFQLGLTTANVNRDARGVNIGLLGTLTRGDMIGFPPHFSKWFR